jgi:hypothetical protein
MCADTLLAYSRIFSGSNGSVKSGIDCGSKTTTVINNCNLFVTAIVSCDQGNCTCNTFRIPQIACSSAPFNTTGFTFGGTRQWYSGKVNVWNAPSQTGFFYISTDDSSVLGLDAISNNKPVSSQIFVKFSSAEPDAKEFDIPSFCPAPRQAGTRNINTDALFGFHF